MSREMDQGTQPDPNEWVHYIFVGFNSQVIALDRDSGELVWQWSSPSGRGFVALLVDGDRLIASVQGYTYCLDPATGAELWNNPLSGKGVGVPCVASVRGNTGGNQYQVQSDEEAARQAHVH